jgi:GxxExxY protein
LEDVEMNEISFRVIQAAMDVHRELGPGLFETVYQRCMAIELRAAGLEFVSELSVPIHYKGEVLDGNGYRLDFLVEGKIIVELKSVETLKPVHSKQLLTYLRLTEMPLGLLINFNEQLLKDGIARVVNNF